MTPFRISLLLLTVLFVALLALPAAASVDYFLDSLPSSPLVDPGEHMNLRIAVVSVCCRTNDPTDAVVTIPLPPGSTNISAPGQFGGWNCDVAGTTVTCKTFLAPNGPYPGIVVDFNAPSSTDGLSYTAKATLTTTAPDDTLSNNTADIHVNVNRILAVTNANDFGAGSLRDTIAHANDVCDLTVACKMTFAAPMKIEPRSQLPAITACSIMIDGGVAGDASQDQERPVEISGANAGFANGLEVRSWCGVTLRGLTINGFGANGVVLAAPKQPSNFGQATLTVQSCFIGTDTKATEARPNGMRGIAVETPFTIANVTNSTISGNRYSGIAVWAAYLFRSTGCRIGAGRDLRALGNGASGVFLDGGWATVDGVIAYNRDFGVAVGPHATHADVVPAGFFANGAFDIDWGLDGPTHTDSTGRMPVVPVLIDAAYGPLDNSTVVRGVLPPTVRPDGSYDSLYAVRLFQVTPAGYV
ncbi:MAG: hypothetical protein ACRD3J_00170, partial [Thermoanaerobaculia bacterium]